MARTSAWRPRGAARMSAAPARGKKTRSVSSHDSPARTPTPCSSSPAWICTAPNACARRPSGVKVTCSSYDSPGWSTRPFGGATTKPLEPGVMPTESILTTASLVLRTVSVRSPPPSNDSDDGVTDTRVARMRIEVIASPSQPARQHDEHHDADGDAEHVVVDAPRLHAGE